MEPRPVQTNQAPQQKPVPDINAPFRPPLPGQFSSASSPVTPPPAPAAPSNMPPPVNPVLDAGPLPLVVDNIPLKQPVAAGQPSPPAAAVPAAPAESDDELDRILQAVNNRVSTPQVSKKSDGLGLVKKAAGLTSKLAAKKEKVSAPAKPVGPIVGAIVVAIMLAAAAVFAYMDNGKRLAAAKQPGTVGTSSTASNEIQAAGGTLVKPGDLDSFAQTLQTKLNSLNDSQDFDSGSLSDKTLGL